MNKFQIKLWEDGNIPYAVDGAEVPNLMTGYIAPTHHPSPFIVILPGGGYGNRAAHEGAPIAEFFTTRGIHAFVVDYRVSPNRHPAPLVDAQRAIKLIRQNAKQWYIDPDRIVTLGFSAGGHLAASTVTLPEVETFVDDEISKQNYLPNGAILCYPVISIDSEYGHVGSGKNLLGDAYEAEKVSLSLEKRVNEKTPKVFLWHTSDDQVVNVKNSLIFGEKLRDLGIQIEMHIYPHGKHGLGLALTKEDVKGWADLAADWVIRNI